MNISRAVSHTEKVHNMSARIKILFDADLQCDV